MFSIKKQAHNWLAGTNRLTFHRHVPRNCYQSSAYLLAFRMSLNAILHTRTSQVQHFLTRVTSTIKGVAGMLMLNNSLAGLYKRLIQ